MQITKPHTSTETLVLPQKRNKAISKKVRECRQAVLRKIKEFYGMSYYELALDIGISETTLINYLKGGRLLNSSLEKIKNYLERI